MDVSDIIFNPSLSTDLKWAVFEVVLDNNVTGGHTSVLVPTDTNDDDVNGSQHARNGGNDFTYRDATDDDLDGASTLGYYEYFSGYGSGYTGHYYQGDMRHFPAIVINPPTYAVSHQF